MSDFRRGEKVIGLAITSGVYYITASIGMQVFALQPQNITPLWLPLGIGLIMYLKFGWQACLGIFIASFAANLPGMMTDAVVPSMGHTAIAGIVDASTPPLAAWFLRQKIPAKLTRSKHLFPFCLYVCLIPTAASAFLLTANLIAGGYIAGFQSLSTGVALTIADSLGILLVYPIYDNWQSEAISFDEVLPTVLASSLSLIFIAIAFQGFSGAIYLVLPTLLYLAASGYRLGHSVTLLIAVVAILSFGARGFGPFAGSDFDDSLMRMMIFIFSTALMSQSIMLHRGELIESAEARELWYQRAIRDALTGLYNRNYFQSRLNDELARNGRTGNSFVLAMIDVDFFKQINDQYGHPFGDKVLRALAHELQALLRSIDVVARIGGEEFAILMFDVSLQQAVNALERLRTQLAANGLNIDHKRFAITVSIGACENGTHSAETLISAADELLYIAKHRGRNCLVTSATACHHYQAH